ncbi:MAG: DUF5685 family protein [Firmicutes bacterium]|nr:DUF5685 family protein [Bacillota bacterium]
MYGYIQPIKSKLTHPEFAVYKSHYCGMCKNLGKQFGQLPRLTTSYDIAFLSVLLTSYKGENLIYNRERCILNPFKKKPCVAVTPLLTRIANASVILSYYKALDGIIDKDGIKYKFAKKMLSKPTKKAIKSLPKVEGKVSFWYKQLRKLEKEQCDSIDRLADCFANMLKDIVELVLEIGEVDEATKKEYDELLSLCYNIGKFVYLIDALDDIGRDCKKLRFNPLCYNKHMNENFLFHEKYDTPKQIKEHFIEANKETLDFIFATNINRCIESFNNIQHIFNGSDVIGLLKNIIYEGLRKKVDDVMTGNLKPVRL